MNHEDLSEPGRYDDAEGWEPKPPPAKYAKLLADYKKANPEEFCRESIFETRPANECTRTSEAKQQPFELFGPMWRTGELSVMVGESGVGKSLLAVQIAESIARGRSELVTGHPSRVTARDVLLLDLEHSDAQFGERYRCPSPIPGKLPVRYRFSSRFDRTTFGELHIPDAFRRDVARYYRHSLQRMLAGSEAKVLIIDNLTLLDPRSTGPAAATRTMQMLKRLTLKYGYSILVLHSSPAQTARTPRSALRTQGLHIPRSAFRIYEPADSIFAIGRTNFAPDLRYIKQLSSRAAGSSSPATNGMVLSSSSPVTCHPSPEVLVYQLARTEGPHSVRSPHVSKGSSATENTESTELALSDSNPHSPLRIPHSSNPSLSSLSPVTHHLSPETAKPFLGFKYGGVAAEEDLIRDYERERREAEAREQSRLRKLQRSSREILVNGIISGDYQRYLRGE